MTNTEDSVGDPVILGPLSAGGKCHNSTNLLVGNMMLATEKKDKTCLVCGDKALGYNFNAISCESCKAFFRRNAHKTMAGRCEGKCNVNVESRSFCKRCRLAKCFTVGMRRDMILDDSQKKLRKQKILINKLRRHGTFPPEDTYAVSEHDIKNTLSEKISPPVTSSVQKQYPYLKDEKMAVLNKDYDIPLAGQAERHRQWEDINDSLFDIVSDMDENGKLLILEMNKAHESSAFLSNTETCLKQVPINATEVFNIADGIVRRIIKVAKQLNLFCMLTKEDQIALLKGSVVEIMMLRSAVNFDVYTETWTLRTSNCFKRSTASSDTSVTSSPVSSTSSSESFDFSKLPQGLDIQKLRDAALQQADISALRAAVKEGAFGHLCKIGCGTDSLGKNIAKEEIDNMSGGSTISSELLKMGNTETKTMFFTYSKFIRSLMSTISGDLIILKFLIILSLFSPDRHGLEDRSAIEKFQEMYADVLKKYIEKRYPDQKNMLARCLMKLTDLRNVNEVHTKMLLKMQIDSIEPLLIEIFDLPQ